MGGAGQDVNGKEGRVSGDAWGYWVSRDTRPSRELCWEGEKHRVWSFSFLRSSRGRESQEGTQEGLAGSGCERGPGPGSSLLLDR